MGWVHSHMLQSDSVKTYTNMEHLLDIRVSVHHDIIYKNDQQDATV
jgi:hypothetical protein